MLYCCYLWCHDGDGGYGSCGDGGLSDGGCGDFCGNKYISNCNSRSAMDKSEKQDNFLLVAFLFFLPIFGDVGNGNGGDCSGDIPVVVYRYLN